MRELEPGKFLAVRAIGGLHVVTLAWDFVNEKDATKQTDLLGFAIERTELQNNQPAERYYLQGIKRFKAKDEGLPPGTPVSTAEHPIQSFQWGDYTAKPATTYIYRVIPVRGEPKLVELDEESATAVKITTEAEEGRRTHDGQTHHDIYFNRGVAGSQAYGRKFGSTKPDEDEPESDQMKWLSRGLFEALRDFIGYPAKQKNPAQYALRAILYEFRYPPIGEAFKKAHKAHVDVDIRYEAQSYKKPNERMIREVGIRDICEPQKSRGGIRHNKFIVLCRKNGKELDPIAVWTGSTNISAGGIFGHSNVGHAIWDASLAGRYLEYWNRLAEDDVTRGPLVDANLAVEPTPAVDAVPPKNRMLTLFCPRDDEETIETLHWYAHLLGSAERIACMTFAFNLDDVFTRVLTKRGDTLRYAVFDKSPPIETTEEIDAVRNTVIAVGSILKKGDLELFIGERLTGFNRNMYIHDKFMLVDPLGDDPIVVTGSANFSNASQAKNDENMLVIRGNKRVADIYFGEFMRVFDHLYARYIVKKLKQAEAGDPDAGYLKEDTKAWLPQHFKPGRKQLRRVYFMG
jgi:hypothetical protein